MVQQTRCFIQCFFLITLLLGGCVSTKQYQQMLVEKDSLEQKAITYSIELADSKNRNLELNRKAQSLESNYEKLSNEKTQTDQELTRLKADKGSLDRDYESLKNKYANINEYFQIVLNDCDKDALALSKKDRVLRAQEDSLKASTLRHRQQSLALDERENAIAILEKQKQQRSVVTEKILKELEQSLSHYKAQGMEITLKNGSVYLSLDETLVFDPGSLEINDQGRKVLNDVAITLNAQSDIGIVIQGNTDRIKISKKAKYLTDNWDLSVLRATAVTRALTEAKLDPNMVTAAGRAAHDPIVSNQTEEGREKNKRTDIIVIPQADNNKNFSIN